MHCSEVLKESGASWGVVLSLVEEPAYATDRFQYLAKQGYGLKSLLGERPYAKQASQSRALLVDVFSLVVQVVPGCWVCLRHVVHQQSLRARHLVVGFQHHMNLAEPQSYRHDQYVMCV